MKKLIVNVARVVYAVTVALPTLVYAGFTAEDGALERVVPGARQEATKPKPPDQTNQVDQHQAQTQIFREAIDEIKRNLKDAVQKDIDQEAKKAAKVATAQVWVARSGITLRKIIEEWGRVADWTVVWEAAELDYPNPATRTFDGSFEKAVKELFEPYKDARKPVLVDGWRGNTVIVISDKNAKR